MPRQYKSKRRAEQAERTKLAIVDAAMKLFLAQGYAQTSIRAIAKEAGVAERTVYVAFKDKTAILMAIANHAFYGELEEGVGHAQILEEVAALPDPLARLRFVVHQTALGLERDLAALARIVSRAVDSDPRLQEWVAEMIDFRHHSMRIQVEAMLGRKLPDGDRTEQMLDELEAITYEDVYWVLTAERGWSRERYEAFVVDMCRVIMERHGVALD